MYRAAVDEVVWVWNGRLWRNDPVSCNRDMTHDMQGIVCDLLDVAGPTTRTERLWCKCLLLWMCLESCHRFVEMTRSLLYGSSLFLGCLLGLAHADCFIRERSFSCKRCSTVSPSRRPSIMWSCKLFCMQASLQKLQVFTSSLKETRKSSKDSPGCCVLRWKFHHSTDSLMCPVTYFLMALITEATLPRSSVLRPRLLTMVIVSREKHNVKACTCFTAVSSPSPDRLMYDSHCVCQAEKSELRSICRSNLGRSPWRKTYDDRDMGDIWRTKCRGQQKT